MFRPAKIYHAIVIIDETRVNTLINRLYEVGICQLKEAEIDLSSKYSYGLFKDLDGMQTRFSLIMDSLEWYKEIIQPGNRLKQLFSPEPSKKHKSMLHSTEEIIEEVKYHLSLIEPKILEKLGKLQKIKEEMQRKEFITSNLSLVPELETNIFKSSENIKVFLGLIALSSLQKIKKELEEKSVIATKESEKNKSFLAIFSAAEEAPNIEKVLHAVGFQALDIPYEDKKPVEIISNIKKEMQKLEDEKREIQNFLKKTQKIYEDKFSILAEELDIAKQKILALQNFKTTQAFSVIEAWVPKKDLEKFHETIKNVSKQYYIEADERNDAPTLLANSKFVEPFEMLTGLYSLPKYKEFDPTPIMAITFTIFFGFMLTDAAYGVILLIFGLVMHRGIGKIDENMKKFALILIILGVSTTIMGIIFGSYFGDFFQKIGVNLPIPIDSMKQIMLTLSIALGIGALHLTTGLIVGFYENLRKGSLKDAMAKQGVWLLFIISLMLFILKQNLVGLVILALAIVLQLLFNFLDGGIVSSLLSVFGFAGFTGDLFSYARLLALAISTSGIALAVNFMVFMVAGLIPILGIPIAIIIFIIGHTFNIVMNSLGGFIHSTRLHFLEFFTKFYDGGGKAYKPFLATRKKTYIKLEGGA